MTGNDFVKFFLRTPLYPLMGNTIVITVTGSKTGRKYSTPVGFYHEGDCVWVLTSRDRTWWRNVKKGADVSLLMHGKNMEAYARAELDEKTVEARLLEYIQHVPIAARSLGIRMENKIPNTDDVARVAKDRLFVKVELPR